MSRTAPPSGSAADARRPRINPTRTVGLGVLSLTLFLAACGNSDSNLGGKVAKDGLGCEVSSVERRTDDVPTPPAAAKVGKKTTTNDIIKAKAKACAADTTQYLTVDVIGATTDGKEFINTYKDQPKTFSIGQSRLIPGLDTGLTGMKVGARRQIVIPAAEAYGKDGYPPQGIGPDEDLVFVVDLVSLGDEPTYCNPVTTVPKGKREGKPTGVDMPKKPVDKTTATVIKEGDGPKITNKSYVTVEYAGFSCAYGSQFDSSWDRDEPITIAMPKAAPTETASQVIPGWTKGLLGKKQGTIVQLDIPFEDAYGAAGSPPDIGPNDSLTFIVQVVKVSKEAPPAPTTTTVASTGETTTTVASTGETTSTTAAGKATSTTAAGK